MNTGSHNLTTHNARGHEAAGRSTARRPEPYKPRLCGNPPLSSVLRSRYPQKHAQRVKWDFPGVEWVAAGIIVICLTALHALNLRENAERSTPTQLMQVSTQQTHTEPEGFGPLTSHGGDHEQSPNTP